MSVYQQQLQDNDLANWRGYQTLLQKVFRTEPKLTLEQKKYYAKEYQRQYRLQHIEERKVWNRNYYLTHKKYFADYHKRNKKIV